MTRKSDNSGPNSRPPKIPQPNGGALYAGGVKGNKGGTGRPPNALRALAREGVAKALPNIARLAENPIIETDGKKTQVYKDADAIAAFNALVKLGLPQQHEVGENPEAPMLTEAQRKQRLKELGFG